MPYAPHPLHYQLTANAQSIDLTTPKVMGILNVTPDSFYDGGKYQQASSIIAQAEKMWKEGACILDIGGYSSRPGAAEVSEEEEIQRVCQAIRQIREVLPHELMLSIDTFRANVAKAAVSEGANIVNDISGGQLDAEMFTTVAKLQVPYIMMHMRGTPQNMASLTDYGNLLEDMIDFFQKQIFQARQEGIKDIIIDPGFGFAKTLTQNYAILKELAQLDLLNCPLLVGVSRKSMIYKLLGTTAQDALNGTTALHVMALERGAHILRVHDVAPAVEAIQLYQQMQASTF